MSVSFFFFRNIYIEKGYLERDIYIENTDVFIIFFIAVILGTLFVVTF